MISPDEVVSLYRERRSALETVNAKRREVRDAYNGELTVALPDIGRRERAAVANLLNSGLDQLSMRVASTLPTVFCPPSDPLVKREVKAAETRKKALLGWWEHNDLRIMQRRRARMLSGYASAPVLIRPDFVRGIPSWQIRNPMGTFAATCANPDDMTPRDCIFAFERSYGWVKHHYPDSFAMLRRRETPPRDARFTLLEYVDADEIVLVVLGDVADTEASLPVVTSMPGWSGSRRYEVLERLPNRAGVCTAVIPGRVTLDKALGQFDGVIGMYAMAMRLMALDVIATEKDVFRDTYLESRPGEQAKFLTGPHDGRTGLVNIITGGTIKEMGGAPGYNTGPMMDRLERAMRLTAGIPAEFGGESSSNIRTGRRGDAVLSAAVDFPVQEQQELLATSLQEENKRAIAVAKGYFGGQRSSFYVNWKGAKGHADFTPDEVFTTDNNVVSFSHAGTDLNGLTIMVGQLVGMGVMSKQTAAELLPLVEDPEQEHDRSVREAVEAALLSGWQQKVAAGEVAPVDAAWVMQQVATDRLELAEAIIKVDERVRERQAAQPPPQSPEAMAGLATGTPAEAQALPGAVPPPGQDQADLAQILGNLRRPQMTLAAERPAVA